MNPELETEVADLGLPRDEAVIFDGADGTFACLVFNIPAELLVRIEQVGNPEASRCDGHKAVVLNHLLELGTRAKEAQIVAEAGQESLF